MNVCLECLSFLPNIANVVIIVVIGIGIIVGVGIGVGNIWNMRSLGFKGSVHG